MPHESNDKPETDSGNAERRSVGRRLQEERRRRGITVQQAAQDLHIDNWLVEALEADNFSALGAPVFAKGHLKKYAQLLGLETDDLLIGYYEAQDKPDMPTMVAAAAESPPRSSGNWPVRAVVFLGILGLLFLLAWYLFGNRWSVAVGQSRAAIAEIQQSGEIQDGAAGQVQLEEPADESLNVPPQDNPPAISEAVAEESPAPVDETAIADIPPPAPGDAGALQVAVSFSRDSWVEIYDGERRRMMYGMGRSGTTRNLNGVPPIQVFLGFADGVTVQVEGRPYPIPVGQSGRNTARFRIAGPAPD